MKHALLCLLLVAVTGCGGFSNDDVVFLSALPRKDDLVTQVPTGSNGQGLTQRKDGLNGVGQPADFHTSARTYVDTFNRSLDTLLGALEIIRRWPPTRRELDRRIWGPAPDSAQPGFDIQLTLERNPDTGAFDWRIEHRKQPAGEFFTTLTGHFEPTMNVRKGQGDIHFLLTAARAGGLAIDPSMATAKSIDLTYDTVPPRKLYESVPIDGRHDFDYRYEETEGGGARVESKFGLDNVPGAERLHTISRWTGTGEGRGDVRIIQGTYAGLFAQIQCWDSAFKVLFVRDDVTSTVAGDRSQCAFGDP